MSSFLRSFLGLVSFSARFLPDFATTVEPLRKVTRQGTDWQRGKEENETFEALKNLLVEASMIGFLRQAEVTDQVSISNWNTTSAAISSATSNGASYPSCS